VRDAFCLQRRYGKTCRNCRQPKHKLEPNRAMAGQNRYDEACNRQGHRRPPGRFAIRTEVDDNAEAKGHRQPRHQPAWRNLGRNPLCQQPTQRAGGIDNSVRQQ
jgi:hypothetical protein